VAPPLKFTPKPLELRSALEVELAGAPAEHAEALVNLYRLLREAQDHGWLDAARGAIAGTDTAVTQLAKYANTQEGITMMRNLVSMAKILGAIDPEVLQGLSSAVASGQVARQRPSLWKVFRLALTPEVITGAVFALGMVAALGKALNKR
jgi:uncharacterized protein YjgD (DUF1641 family)